MADQSSANFDEMLTRLTPADRAAIRARMTLRSYEPRQQIFGQNEDNNRFMVVESGRVRTFSLALDGHEITTGIWSAGFSLGLISGLAGVPRVLSCEAIDRTTVRILTMAELQFLVTRIPQLGFELAKLIAGSAAKSIARAALFSTTSVRGRLIATLVSLGDLPDARTGPDSAVVTGLSHEDIASLVRASRPWISLTIRELEEQGYLRLGRMQIEIPSLTALASADSETTFVE